MHSSLTSAEKREYSYASFPGKGCLAHLKIGITIGANQSLLNNIGEFGIQAAILAICGVLGSLVASFIAYKLFIKKGGLNEK